MNTPDPSLPDFAALTDAELQAELERRIDKHHEPRRNYAQRFTADQLARAALALTIALTVTVITPNAANDEGPTAPATTQRIAA